MDKEHFAFFVKTGFVFEQGLKGLSEYPGRKNAGNRERTGFFVQLAGLR